MALDVQTEKDLLEKVGKEATDATKTELKKSEEALNAKFDIFQKGGMTKAEFDAFKGEVLEPVQSKLSVLEDTATKQGNKINELMEGAKAKPNSKSFEQFMIEQGDKIKEFRSKGQGVIEISGAQLKAAGVSTIGTEIPIASPYAPGIGGGPLEIFEIARNQAYITNKVNLGRTNQARLAWINETSLQGNIALVGEGQLKPLTQHTFTIETSVAKKIAGYVAITEELDQDLPYLSTIVQRMLQKDVFRFWDDQIQLDVIGASTPYNITTLNGMIQAANLWDALLAQKGQVGAYNFVPNTVAINYLTNVLLKTEKTTQNQYLLPAFVDELMSIMNFANKVTTGYGLTGDLTQYNVDIYKDFILKIGWVNDDLIRNQFSVVGEIRYHSYISQARKTAICYDNLNTMATLLLKTP